MDASAAVPIMIIGHDSDFSYLMQRYVRQSGHHTVIAGLYDETVALARQTKPAAIVLEVDVQEPAGWGVLQTLKADQATHDIPIVLCSWRDERARSVAEGADAFLRKPVMYKDFLATLSKVGV